MSWFKRSDKKIVTPTKDKKETPDGLWYKTPKGDLIETKVLEQNNFVTPDEGFHTRIGSRQYFEIIFDTNKYQTIAPELQPGDPLTFEDTKKYSDRIVASQKKTGLKDAMEAAYGKTNGHPLVVACMDFSFIGGSMGSVVGEKIAKAIEKTIPCKRVGIAVIGLEVPHAHIHLIPLQNVEDINFSKPKLRLDPDMMKGIAEKIISGF